MIPGSSVFKRINDEWLVSRTAAILFAISSFLIIVVTPISFNILRVPDTTQWDSFLFGVLGVSGALSVFFLCAGMWHYWLTIDASRPAVKRMWFLLLLAGFWYGAILYFLWKYIWIDKCPSGRAQCTGGE